MSLATNDERRGLKVRRHSGWRCALVGLVLSLSAAQLLGQTLEQHKLTASDATSDVLFGDSVSISGDTAMVGSVFDDCAAGVDCGSAYVYRSNGTSWVQQQKLTASDASANDHFGLLVSVSGDTAVIGAYGDDCVAGVGDCGSAYVFRFNGTSWVEEQKLTASDAAAGDEFGFPVSVNGNTAIVGARMADCVVGLNCGAAYVFRFNGTSWVQVQKLTAFDATAGVKFGNTVSLSGNTAVVGAPFDNCAAGFDCGSAYVFRFNGTSWVQEQKLTASDAALSEVFGVSVSLSEGEGTVLVGAFFDKCAAGSACGSAYVFRFNGNSWVEEQKLTASDAAMDDQFGFSVSLSGNTAVVGSQNDDCPAGIKCGSAYVYRYDGTSWIEEPKLTASDAAEVDFFGRSVSVSGGTAVIGAFGDNCGAGGNCGAAYVFRIPAGESPLPPNEWGVTCATDADCDPTPGLDPAEGAKCVGGVCYRAKHRYLSFNPTAVNVGTSVAYSVDIPGVGTKYLGPRQLGDVSLPNRESFNFYGLVDTFAEATKQVWKNTCSGNSNNQGAFCDTDGQCVNGTCRPGIVHVGGCQIVPGSVLYDIRATEDGVLFSNSLSIPTAAIPSDGRPFGDLLGGKVGTQFSAQDGVVNANDISATVAKIENDPNTPHMSLFELQPAPGGLNAVKFLANSADLGQVVAAFEFANYPNPTNPADCP